MKRDEKIDEIEDEIDRLASVGDAASKLRIEILARRKKRERERTLRPTDSNVDRRADLPVQGGSAEGEGPEVP